MAFYSDSKLNKNLVFGDEGQIGSVNFENYTGVDNIYTNPSSSDSYNSETISEWKTGGSDNDKFGKSVAISNHKIIVGATGVWEGGQNAGKIYVYNLDGTEYSSFQNSFVQTDSGIGFPMAAGNNIIVVGSDNRDSISVHDFDGTQLWSVQKSSVDFPSSISVACGRVVVGAKRSPFNDRGQVFIYTLDGTQINVLSAGNNSGLFGSSVSINSGKIVVGESGNGNGQAYLYDLFGMKLAGLNSTLSGGSAEFGYSTAIGSNRIAVGAPKDTSMVGGSVHLYDLWGNQIAKIGWPNPEGYETSARFGHSIAIYGNRIFVGAPSEPGSGLTPKVFTYDLDGNYIEQIVKPGLATLHASDTFGESIAVGHGKLVIGDSAFSITTPSTNIGAAFLYRINFTKYEDYLERISEDRNTKYTPEE